MAGRQTEQAPIRFLSIALYGMGFVISLFGLYGLIELVHFSASPVSVVKALQIDGSHFFLGLGIMAFTYIVNKMCPLDAQ